MSEADIKAIADEMVRRYPENLSSISIEGRGFMLGATWGLERAHVEHPLLFEAAKHYANQVIQQAERIEELESKLKLADRNNELLRGHRDELEAKIKPEDDIIPEDYYIK